jgi:four helix bundle protein
MAAGNIVRSYKDLDVWSIAMSLAEHCYRVTKAFPHEELYGMTSQIRRSSVSIPANIAEGYGRDQTGSFVQFLRIAQGSARELETHVILSGRVGLLQSSTVADLLDDCERVSKMLRSMIRSLETETEPKGSTEISPLTISPLTISSP